MTAKGQPDEYFVSIPMEDALQLARWIASAQPGDVTRTGDHERISFERIGDKGFLVRARPWKPGSR